MCKTQKSCTCSKCLLQINKHCGTTSTSYGSSSDMASQTVHSAPLDCFVGASQTTEWSLSSFQSSMSASLTHSHHRNPCDQKRDRSLSLCSLGQQKNETGCCSWPFSYDFHHLQQLCHFLTRIIAETQQPPRMKCINAPSCMLTSSTSPGSPSRQVAPSRITLA